MSANLDLKPKNTQKFISQKIKNLWHKNAIRKFLLAYIF